MLWLVCLVTLALAAWCDVRTRRVPAALPVGLTLALAWPLFVQPRAWVPVLVVTLIAVGVLVLARVGLGDVALMAPVALTLGVWVLVALAVSLAAGCVTLARRQRPDDPFVPQILGGFLVASGLRWAVGG